MSDLGWFIREGREGCCLKVDGYEEVTFKMSAVGDSVGMKISKDDTIKITRANGNVETIKLVRESK